MLVDHQRDCCGGITYSGINETEWEAFLVAEDQCRENNPAVCNCKPQHTTEDGTPVPIQRALRVVCEEGSCRATIVF